MSCERVIDLCVGEKITLRIHVGKSPELGDVSLTYQDVVLVGCQPSIEWNRENLLCGGLPLMTKPEIKCTLIMEPT